MLHGIIIGAILVIGLAVYYLKRKSYIARKEASLKQSAANLANEEAAKVTAAVQEAAEQADKAVADATPRVS